MPEILIGLLWLLVYLAIIALVSGVAIWALQQLWPSAPAIVPQALKVIAVLLAVIIIVSWLFGVLPRMPR